MGAVRRLRQLIGPVTRAAAARRATIDTASVPAITPLQPIDLTDDAAVTQALDLALRVGAVLLDAGTGAIDTRAQTQFVASLYGLANCEVDVTYNAILVTAHRGPTLPPASTMRLVHYRSLDFTRLAQVDRLIRTMRRRALSPAQAHAALDAIVTAGHPYPRWLAALAWAGMAASVSVFLGATALVAAVAFLTTVVIYRVNVSLNRLGLPLFFQQVAGGMVATLPATVLYAFRGPLGIDIRPSQVIAAGVIVLLAGLSLVGAVQDAITGAPITASARLLEVFMLTGGIIAGVAMALRVSSAFGVVLPPLEAAAPEGFGRISAQVAAAAGTALFFALASYAERRALPAAAMGGAVGMTAFLLAAVSGVGVVLAGAVAATVVGFVGGLLARRALTPPLVVAVAGITPMLPGLTLYRGLSAILDGDTVRGFGSLATAFAIGGALAAGVTLGEWGARTLQRPRITWAKAA